MNHKIPDHACTQYDVMTYLAKRTPRVLFGVWLEELYTNNSESRASTIMSKLRELMRGNNYQENIT
jgi:hypothetical protein